MAGANNYVSGNCTWWVKHQADWVPNGWGNAAEWWAHAQQSSFPTSSAPSPGAVAVWGPGIDPPQGYGHVALVSAVQPDGCFTVSEMNWKGLGVVDTRNVCDRSNLLGFIGGTGSADSVSRSGGGGQVDLTPVGNALQSAGQQLQQVAQVGGGGLLILIGLALAVLLLVQRRGAVH